MIKLKKLKLTHYCGFQSLDIDFDSWTILYGPNGSFKSSLLEAVRMVSCPMTFTRDCSLLFRKLTYHPDYKPGYEGFDTSRTELHIEGIFETTDGDKKVIIQNDWTPEGSGTICNEISEISQSPTIYIDADHPLNMSRFQLIGKYQKEFVDFAKVVYGLDCYLDTKRGNVCQTYDAETRETIEFITDFIIVKKGNTKVHFKSMSDGEKKIATLLRTLFNRCYKNDENTNDIILIDNIAQHIYFKRHMILIEKLKEYFPNKQFIITTHSPVIIDQMDKNCLLDMENI
jgi:AAA15 family ATPase/GTPase